MIRNEYSIISLNDSDRVIRHLETMAERGWKLEKAGALFWRYREIQPQPLHYAVAYVEDYTPAQEQYTDLCAAAGWELVAQRRTVMIFCSDAEDPVPLETDPAVQARGLGGRVAAGAVFALWLLLEHLHWYLDDLKAFFLDPMGTIGSRTEIASVLVSLFCLFSVGAAVLFWCIWCVRAFRAKKEGRFLPSVRDPRSIFRILWPVLGVVFLVLEAPILAGEYLYLVLFIFTVTILFMMVQGRITAELRRRGVGEASWRWFYWGSFVVLGLMIAVATILTMVHQHAFWGRFYR